MSEPKTTGHKDSFGKYVVETPNWNKYSEFDFQKHEHLHSLMGQNDKIKPEFVHALVTGDFINNHLVSGLGKTMNIYEQYTAKNLAKQWCHSIYRDSILDRYTLLADFYALSIFFKKDNIEDCRLRDDIFPRIREYLLKYVHLAVVGEIGHFQGHVYKISAGKKCTDGTYWHERGKDKIEAAIWKRFQLDISEFDERIRSRQVRGCKIIFKNTKNLVWSSAYGGPAWERICDRWLALESHCDQENIDRLIDCCHNTGNVLNKSLHGIDMWLGIKTKNKNACWLIDQCSFAPYAYRRIYEETRITKEKFAKMI